MSHQMESWPPKVLVWHALKEKIKQGGLTKEIKIHTLKWEVIYMDFITSLPCNLIKHDFIWVIVDRPTNSGYFLLLKTSDSVKDYAKLYINEFVQLNRVPLSIILYKGPQFTCGFWKSFHKCLVIQVNLNITFHPRMNGHSWVWDLDSLKALFTMI